MPDFSFCPKCGGPLVERERDGRLRLICDRCGFVFYRNPIVGVAVVVLEGGRILLGRRAGSYRGAWCIPCGYVEWDEDVREAARREFHEETGLEVAIGEVYAVHSNFHNPKQHTVGVWFLGERTGGELRPGGDLDEVAFFALDTLPDDLCFPTDRLVLEKLRAEE
ncbi:MAG: NUDIX hydrolase [Chloroflexi bacterium]|nr:NUDIX hydrolase [Chloroflexota bacterium]